MDCSWGEKGPFIPIMECDHNGLSDYGPQASRKLSNVKIHEWVPSGEGVVHSYRQIMTTTKDLHYRPPAFETTLTIHEGIPSRSLPLILTFQGDGQGLPDYGPPASRKLSHVKIQEWAPSGENGAHSSR